MKQQHSMTIVDFLCKDFKRVLTNNSIIADETIESDFIIFSFICPMFKLNKIRKDWDKITKTKSVLHTRYNKAC